MSPEIFTFKKTLQERLDECMDVLCTRGVKVPASQVVNEWRYYMSQILEPCGWQALWKLSRLSCDKFCVKYPTFVYVEVLSSDLHILCSTVNILAVQDDLHLPEQVQVPLQHLYPTKQQTNNVLNIDDTANCIDQLRFFYDHVWQPWDIDDDEIADWPSEHLESRIQLYYDMQTGIVFRETGEHIRALLDEGRTVQSRIAMLEEPMSDNDEVSDYATFNLMELNLRKEQIKTELQMLENPVMRNLFVQKRQEMALSKRGPTNDNSKKVCFIWLGGSVDEFINSLTQAKLFVSPDAFIRSSSLLQEALDQAIAGDTIILCAGIHGIRGSGALEEGGLIRGISTPDKTTLQAQNAGTVLFDCSSNIVVLENLTVDTHMVQTALLVRQGTIRLRNCHVVGKDMTSQGVLVLAGSKLEAQHCCFSGLMAAVVVDSGGEVELTSCKISECKVGFQLYDDSSVNLQMCNISGCLEGGIRVETSLQSDQIECAKAGSIAMLDGLPKVKVDNTTLENNAKGDVTLVKNDAVVFCESLDTGCLIGGIQQDEGVLLVPAKEESMFTEK